MTDFGLVHGTESIQMRLELWLGNTTITIDGEKRKFEGKKLKDLAQQPIKYKHTKRNWVVKIGADAQAKQLTIHINGVPYEDLAEWDDHGISQSSFENNWKGKIKKTDYTVMDND